VDINDPQGAVDFVRYRMEKLLKGVVLKHKEFAKCCLEFGLQDRITTYVPDEEDNVKILLAVSGAGKTRTLLELLHDHYGYYYTVQSSVSDFGSGDLSSCMTWCNNNKDRAKFGIELLHFVRAVVCDYLVTKLNLPASQVLLAQVHPNLFFQCDIFDKLFNAFITEHALNLTGM
jgi:hypothetical protein